MDALLPAAAALVGAVLGWSVAPVAGLPAGMLGLACGVVAALGTWRAVGARAAGRIARAIDHAERVGTGRPAPHLGPRRADAFGCLEDALRVMGERVACTMAALRLEQDRLEAILRGMVEGVVVTDLSGAVARVNDRAREMLGVPPTLEVRGRPLVDLARDPGIGDLLREIEGGADSASRDVSLTGRNVTLQVNAARLRGADGTPFGIVLVLHDVTQLRRLEVVRRDFVANVSHELRTPLTAIKGYAETLLGPAGDDRDTARRFLTVIDRHSERLGRLIDDLHALSDLELGRTPMRIGAINVGAAVDDVLQIFAERVARASVRIAAAIADDTPPALADGDRVRQVLINLVDNAIKYTQPGGHVVVRAAPVADATSPTIEIAVEDTGVGIPAQDLPRLTERFFRVDKARSRELGGTGLGLAIVKHIVQALGGSLEITSALGQGTTARVLLPAAAGTRPPAAERTAG